MLKAVGNFLTQKKQNESQKNESFHSERSAQQIRDEKYHGGQCRLFRKLQLW